MHNQSQQDRDMRAIPLPPRRSKGNRYASPPVIQETTPSPRVAPKEFVAGDGRRSRVAGGVVQLGDRDTPKRATGETVRVSLDSDVPVSPRVSQPLRRQTQKQKSRNDRGGIRLTERDIVILTFAAKYRLVTVSLMARLTDSTPAAIKTRINKLHNWGLLGKIHGRVAVVYHSVAKTGAALGVEVSTGAPAYSRIDHDLLLTGVAVELAMETQWAAEHVGNNPIILSERQLRSSYAGMRRDMETGTFSDEPFDPHAPTLTAYLACPMGIDGSAFYPDLVTVDISDEQPRFVSVELELSPKKDEEYRAIFSAYENNAYFSKVVYLTDKPHVKKRVERAARFISSSKVEVKLIDLEDIGGRVVG